MAVRAPSIVSQEGAMALLKFSGNNSKMKKLSKATGKKVYAFDLPAGWSCPAAQTCLSKADKVTGKITDGKDATFRCYAASLEAVFPACRKLRWHNFDLLQNTSNMYQLLEDSLPSETEIIRIHSSGDFFNAKYLEAWITVAGAHPLTIIYGYTKRLDLLERLTHPLPGNMRLVTSVGGKYDDINVKLPSATVVDHTLHPFPVFSTDADSELHILNGGGDFGLMIHGVQPKGWNGFQ